MYAAPVAEASVDARVSYLRKVGLWTFAGLSVATITSIASAAFFLFVAPFLLGGLASTAVILGCWFAAHMGCRSLVFSGSTATKVTGFFGGMVFQGIALGQLVLFAVLMSVDLYANPLALVFQALALVGATAFGMMGWLMTGPKNLSRVGAILGTLSIPMLIAMAISFAFPINGALGILISVGFVAFSGLALLYQLEQVIHQMSTEQHIEGAFTISMGLLILFWNVLVLLMKLQRR